MTKAERNRIHKRKLRIEQLGQRILLASNLHNLYEPLDVNEDLRVSAIDALRVINHLSAPNTSGESRGLCDVNDSGDVTSADALILVNALSRGQRHSVMRLVDDTGPNGQNNRDQITSDPTIEGRIEWPTQVSVDEREPFLEMVRPNGEHYRLPISEYVVGDYFKIPRSIAGGFRSLANPSTGDLSIELRYPFSTPDAETTPLADLHVRLDWTPPKIVLPQRIQISSVTASVHIEDTLDLIASSRESEVPIDGSVDVRFSTEGETIPYQVRRLPGLTAFDLDLSGLNLGDKETIKVSVDAVVKDLAGNEASLSPHFYIQREAPNHTLEFVGYGPSSGTGFFLNGITVNPGQLIRLPVQPLGLDQSITVSTARLFDADGNIRNSIGPFEPKVVDEILEPIYAIGLTGEAVFRIPEAAVSGPIRDAYGRVLGRLHVVPTTNDLRVQDGAWLLPPQAGGLNPNAVSYRYRFLDHDLSEGEIAEVRYQETLNWPSLSSGNLAPAFGFNPIQLAGDGGVSEPIDLGFAFPNLGAIYSIAADPDGTSLWLGLNSRIVKIDTANAEVLSEMASEQAAVILNSESDPAFTARHLYVVPATAFADAVDYVDDRPASISDQTWVLAYLHGQEKLIVLDHEDGHLVGSIPYARHLLRSLFENRTAAAPAYHPELAKWITIAINRSHGFEFRGRFIRQHSVHNGELESEQLAIGSHEFSTNSQTLSYGKLAWDPSESRLVAFGFTPDQKPRIVDIDEHPKLIDASDQYKPPENTLIAGFGVRNLTFDPNGIVFGLASYEIIEKVFGDS